MLYFDAPIGPIEGLMIYRDHQDPNLFYYVPERPRLARNEGVPEFIYLKYKRDITDNPALDPAVKESLGGGFLAFTVDLGVSDEQLDAIKEKLGAFATGEVKLTPIQFRKGSVRLSTSKDLADAPGSSGNEQRGLRFFEHVYGASKPSLFGFNRATFSLVLTQEAATLFEAALNAGVSPVGVIYDLEFLGLRPAFNVRITAEYHRIYEHLEMEFSARGQIQVVSLAVDIGVAFQKLRDQGVIKVEVLNFTDEENLRKQADEAFNWFKTEMLKDFFKSSLEPPAFMKQSSSGGLLGQLQSLLGPLSQTQSGASTPQLGTPTNQTGTAAPAPNSLSSNVQSTSSTNAAAQGQGGAGASGGADRSVAPFQVGFSLKYYKQEELKTRIFEYGMQAASPRDAAPQGLFTTMIAGLDLRRCILEVNLDDDFFKRLIANVSIGGDLAAAGISKVAVNLEYPGVRKPNVEPDQVGGFTFSPDDLTAKEFTSWLNAAKDLRYSYYMDMHFKPDSPWFGKEAHITVGPIVTRDRVLTLDPLDHVGLLDVPISLGDMDSNQVSQMQVELRYDDPDNNFSARKTFLLKPGDSGARWRLRLSNPELRSYSYRVLYLLQENARLQTDWVRTDDASLIINEPFRGNVNLRLVPLLDAQALQEAIVDLTYAEPATGYRRLVQKVFTPTELKSQTVTLPTLADQPSALQYEVTIVRADGSVYHADPVETTEAAVVISDGAGKTHRIRVKLVPPDLNRLGLAAVQVDLSGPGSEPDRDTVLFTPSQVDDRTVSLVQPDAGGEFKYRYQVTGYTTQGLQVPGASGESSSPILIVSTPHT